jgi:methylenetetrahydrofolate reductase (NADPH)
MTLSSAHQSAAKPGASPVVSYEFFPPKTAKMEKALWTCVDALAPLSPDFVSVTYGAGGSTRERTFNVVKELVQKRGISAAAHLTCVGASQSDIDQIADEYWDAGVKHIVALRGDPPEGMDGQYRPVEGGYPYGSDLVAGLKARHDFEISVAAYPERHPESGNWDVEMDNLRRKVDAGASRAITQFFLSAEPYFRFLDRIEKASINIEVTPGIMMQPNFGAVQRMAGMCGVAIPARYGEMFDGLEDQAETRKILTASLVSEMINQLKEQGQNSFHLYTLNKPEIAFVVSRVLGLKSRAA